LKVGKDSLLLKKYVWPILLILLVFVLGLSLLQKDFVNSEPTATPVFTQTDTPTITTTMIPSATSTPTLSSTWTPTPTETFTPTSTPTETPSWVYLDDDGDGIMNYADQCPNQYAETENGCPSSGSGGDSDEEKPPGGNE